MRPDITAGPMLRQVSPAIDGPRAAVSAAAPDARDSGGADGREVADCFRDMLSAAAAPRAACAASAACGSVNGALSVTSARSAPADRREASMRRWGRLQRRWCGTGVDQRHNSCPQRCVHAMPRRALRLPAILHRQRLLWCARRMPSRESAPALLSHGVAEARSRSRLQRSPSRATKTCASRTQCQKPCESRVARALTKHAIALPRCAVA